MSEMMLQGQQTMFRNTRLPVFSCLLADSCHAGSHKNVSTMTCTPCSQGHYQNLNDQLSCFPCEMGYFQNETGKGFCYSCPKMKTTFQLSADNESLCKGKEPLSILWDKFSCVCQDKKLQKAASLADPCPFGHHIDLQTSQCARCPAGYYQDQLNQLSCKPCGFGFYQNESGQQPCSKCPPGKITRSMIADSITLCHGNYSKFDLSFCETNWKKQINLSGKNNTPVHFCQRNSKRSC